MINAVLNKKADIQRNEDVKTSSILGLLLLLPAEMFWKLLRSSMSDTHMLPASSGDILNSEFWPHWNVDNKDTEVTNQKLVEPDVFIEFENFDLIIEVKLDGNFQYSDQWTNEVCAYKSNISTEKELIFVALGGNASLDSILLTKGRAKGTTVHKCSWNRLLEVVHSEVEYQEHATYPYDRHILRILHMIEKAYTIYGERVTLWMESIPTSLLNIDCNCLHKFKETWNQLK